jgi:drug/metabolite transporter (DMT)-like permease
MKSQYEILLPEFMEMAWIRHRSSIRWFIGIGVGLIGLVVGILFYAYADPVPGIFLAVLSTFLLLMQFVVPTFVFRRFYRRNSRMVGPRTVTISDNGITSDHQLGRSESSWNTYFKFQETARSFLLYQSADVIGILPKRAFATNSDLQEFRALLAAKIPNN